MDREESPKINRILSVYAELAEGLWSIKQRWPSASASMPEHPAGCGEEGNIDNPKYAEIVFSPMKLQMQEINETENSYDLCFL